MRFPLKRRPVPPAAAQAVQTAPAPGLFWEGQGLMGLEHQCQLYDRLRQSVPIIDAALCKIVRLTMGEISLTLTD